MSSCYSWTMPSTAETEEMVPACEREKRMETLQNGRRRDEYRYCTGKKTPGGAGTHTGHARDTRAHTGTRNTQTNLTTIQTQTGKKTPGGAGTHTGHTGHSTVPGTGTEWFRALNHTW